jgi:hypothetical protein
LEATTERPRYCRAREGRHNLLSSAVDGNPDASEIPRVPIEPEDGGIPDIHDGTYKSACTHLVPKYLMVYGYACDHAHQYTGARSVRVRDALPEMVLVSVFEQPGLGCSRSRPGPVYLRRVPSFQPDPEF